jgi:hypothetical protein
MSHRTVVGQRQDRNGSATDRSMPDQTAFPGLLLPQKRTPPASGLMRRLARGRIALYDAFSAATASKATRH